MNVSLRKASVASGAVVSELVLLATAPPAGIALPVGVVTIGGIWYVARNGRLRSIGAAVKTALSASHERHLAALAAKANEPGLKAKTYKNTREYNRDAKKMMRAGWRLAAQTAKERNTAIGRTLVKGAVTGGIGLLVLGRAKKGDTLTITWVRGATAQEDGAA